MELNKTIAAEFEHEMGITRRFFENLKDDVLDYQPHEKSMNFRKLANHLLGVPALVPAVIKQKELDFSVARMPEDLQTAQEMLEALDQRVVDAKETLNALTDEQLGEPWTMRNGETVYMTIPKQAAMRNLVINHLIHHRAQLGVYFRLNNMKVPATYGGSADEPMS